MRALNKIVSYFSNYYDNVPKDVELLKFITSPKYKYEIEQIRNAQTKQQKDALKSKLPAVTPSGIFHTKRKIENLVEHSGMIQIDIDGKDNAHLNMRVVKEQLKQVRHISFCAYSASGNGLYALVPISDPNRHKEHFMALEEDFKYDFNIVIDKSCKDVTRLRGYSYDATYYLNENALVYDGMVEFEQVKIPQTKRVHIEAVKESDKFYKALNTISSNSLDITGSNGQWFEILCAIANEYGEGGRGYAHIVSQYSGLYDSTRCDKDYSRAVSTNYSYGIGTFFHYFNQNITHKPP